MATLSNQNNLALLEKLKDYQKLKKDFAEKLIWRFTDWEEAGLANGELHKLVKRTKFWFKNLKESNNDKLLLLTLFKEGIQTKMEAQNLLLNFKSQLGRAGLQGFSETKNPAFIVLAFNTKEQRDFAAENYCIVDDYFVINSDWVISDAPADIRVLWLPPIIDITIVSAELSKYVELISLFAENYDLDDGDIIPSGKFVGKFKKKDNISLDSIPHLINFEGYQSLIVIPKRQPLCLNCSNLGHISQKCPTPFCQRCQRRLPTGHQCIINSKFVSFAEVVKSGSAMTGKSMLNSSSSNNSSKISACTDRDNMLGKNLFEVLADKEEEDQLPSILTDSSFTQEEEKTFTFHTSDNFQENTQGMEYQTANNKRTREQLETGDSGFNIVKHNTRSCTTYSKKSTNKQIEQKGKDLFDTAKKL